MKAEEARMLTSQCILYNDQRNYDYAISKIIPACSNGLNYYLVDINEIYDSTIKRLVSDGFNVELLPSINLIRISW